MMTYRPVEYVDIFRLVLQNALMLVGLRRETILHGDVMREGEQ
jgi:hypothetical protein